MGNWVLPATAFYQVMPWQSIDGSQTVPNFQVGQKCSVAKVELQEKLTGMLCIHCFLEYRP